MTDASNLGLGAILLHKEDNGQLKAVVKNIITGREKLQPTEKEAQSIISAVKKFHKFLHGRRFILLTHHHPLLFGSKKSIPAHTVNHLQRWSTNL